MPPSRRWPGWLPQHAQAATPKLKVIGFAAIYKNSAHLVHAKNGGSLSNCQDPRSFSVVVDVANIVRGTPTS